MMPVLKISSGKLEINGNEMIKEVNLEIQPKERVALLGANGVGKTTLLKAIMDEVPFAAGHLTINAPSNRVGYLKQNFAEAADCPVLEYVQMRDPERYRIKKQMDRILKDWNDETEAEYSDLLACYIELNGYEWEGKIENTLMQMGIGKELWNKPFSVLSGGQKTKAGLAGILVNNPVLLLLDEPTNHVDMETVSWLKTWLQKYEGTVLFVSHDRAFIDDVATCTVEVTPNGLIRYQGGYSEFREQKDVELKTFEAAYQKQQKEKKKLKEMIQLYKEWFQKKNATASVRDPFAQKQASKGANKYKVKEKALEKLENNSLERPDQKNVLQANFKEESFSPRRFLEFSDASFSYGKNTELFDDIQLIVERGDRFGIVGKNGAGKTTLLKLAAGLLEPEKGTIKRNPQLKIGFFMQELTNLNNNMTILESILEIPDMSEDKARTILANFMFRKEDVYKKISAVSMGEKCRVAFVKLYFSGANLLVLDEPTNYLDIATRDRIEEALENYPGALLVVSHDTYLLRRLCNKVIHISENQVHVYPYPYKEWEGREKNGLELAGNKVELYLLELEIIRLLGEMSQTSSEEERERIQSEIIEMEKKKQEDKD